MQLSLVKRHNFHVSDSSWLNERKSHDRPENKEPSVKAVPQNPYSNKPGWKDRLRGTKVNHDQQNYSNIDWHVGSAKVKRKTFKSTREQKEQLLNLRIEKNWLNVSQRQSKRRVLRQELQRPNVEYKLIVLHFGWEWNISEL